MLGVETLRGEAQITGASCCAAAGKMHTVLLFYAGVSVRSARTMFDMFTRISLYFLSQAGYAIILDIAAFLLYFDMAYYLLAALYTHNIISDITSH